MNTNTSKLSGKIALITGGTSGIGLATAQRFIAEGAQVFITGRRHAELNKAVEHLGSSATGIQGDISRLEDLDRLSGTLQQQPGRLDSLADARGLGGAIS